VVALSNGCHAGKVKLIILLDEDSVKIQFTKMLSFYSRVGHVYRGFMPYNFGKLAEKAKGGSLIHIVSFILKIQESIKCDMRLVVTVTKIYFLAMCTELQASSGSMV